MRLTIELGNTASCQSCRYHASDRECIDDKLGGCAIRECPAQVI